MTTKPEDASGGTATRTLRPRTLICFGSGHEDIVELDGLLPLPVGALVELSNPNRTGTVVRVRLQFDPTDHEATLCLDVDEPVETTGGM